MVDGSRQAQSVIALPTKCRTLRGDAHRTATPAGPLTHQPTGSCAMYHPPVPTPPFPRRISPGRHPLAETVVERYIPFTSTMSTDRGRLQIITGGQPFLIAKISDMGGRC
jgi:hypothetical protein